MLMAPLSTLTIRNRSVTLDQGHMINIKPFTFVHVKNIFIELIFSLLVYQYRPDLLMKLPPMRHLNAVPHIMG